MKALTQDEVQSWAASHRNLVVEPRELRFRTGEAKRLHFHFPTGEGQLVYFARLLASLHHEEPDFAGALIYVTAWGVWSRWVEDVGLKIVTALHGKKKPFHLYPGHLFDANELLESVAFLLQPILIGWDAYYYPSFKTGDSDFLVKISHDAYADVMPETERARKQILERLAKTAFAEADCHSR